MQATLASSWDDSTAQPSIRFTTVLVHGQTRKKTHKKKRENKTIPVNDMRFQKKKKEREKRSVNVKAKLRYCFPFSPSFSFSLSHSLGTLPLPAREWRIRGFPHKTHKP